MRGSSHLKLGTGQEGPASSSFSSNGAVDSPLGIKGAQQGSRVVIPHPSDACSVLRLSYKCVEVTWILSTPCNVPDVVVKKLDGAVRDGSRTMSLKGWEAGRVLPSLNLVFGFLSRSGFLVVCIGTPLLTVAFAVF